MASLSRVTESPGGGHFVARTSRMDALLSPVAVAPRLVSRSASPTPVSPSDLVRAHIAHVVLNTARSINVQIDDKRSRIAKNAVTGTFDVSVVVNDISRTDDEASMLKSSLLSCLMEDLSELQACIMVHVPEPLMTYAPAGKLFADDFELGTGTGSSGAEEKKERCENVLAHVRGQRAQVFKTLEHAVVLMVQHNLSLVIAAYPWRDAGAMSSLVEPMALKALVAFRKEAKFPSEEDMDCILRPMNSVLALEHERQKVAEDCRNFAEEKELSTLLGVYTTVYRICRSTFARSQETRTLFTFLFVG